MPFSRLVSRLPDGFGLTLADVGSAGGLHHRWTPVRPVLSALLFEPREGGEIRHEGRNIVFPLALGAQSGRATLNVTALPNVSSTLSPNAALLGTIRKKAAHSQIVDRFDMPVEALDTLARRHAVRVDALKIDTQGSELEILEGCRDVLATSLISAEVEVSFLERYQGQPLAADIIAFMAAQGFELIDLQRLKRYRLMNRAGIGNISLGAGQRAGRLAYGDAIFFIGHKRLGDRIAQLPAAEAEVLALKAILLLLVYGKADLAARSFDLLADHVAPDRRRQIESVFASLRRRQIRSNLFHHVVDYIARSLRGWSKVVSRDVQATEE